MTTHTRVTPARTTIATDALRLATTTVVDADTATPTPPTELHPGTRFCPGCSRVLPHEEFGTKGNRLQPRCKPCRAAARRATYATNGDAEQAKRRAQRAEARAERKAAKAAEREAVEAAKRAAKYAREDARDDAREIRNYDVVQNGKKCPKCGEHQSAACFYEREDSSDGFQSWCIGCLYTAAAERQRENADEINAYRRTLRADRADERPGPTRWY